MYNMDLSLSILSLLAANRFIISYLDGYELLSVPTRHYSVPTLQSVVVVVLVIDISAVSALYIPWLPCPDLIKCNVQNLHNERTCLPWPRRYPLPVTHTRYIYIHKCLLCILTRTGAGNIAPDPTPYVLFHNVSCTLYTNSNK